MKVLNEITILELDGTDTFGLDRPQLEVRSHWNDRDFVVLHYGEMTITVCANDLEKALSNATNVRL